MVPFVCAFTNIITIKSSFQENRLVCYEYVNEEASNSIKRILHTFVTLSTCVSARLSVVSLLSPCAVWGTDHVTLDVRFDVEV